MIKQADWETEGGNKGRKLMFSGTPKELATSNDLITKPYL
ncbi:hypothetical protein RV15_GL000872 [Enterococcus silesiacus]|uniref:Uncharacterized protein n=1 Tax=Enterococcus silesiacus TaxID=332949 RepID=A0AA91GJJ6_9ENTE|nr:hypothetical protein RV15_GL000872 [Enterococcus silesiacus]